MQAERSLAYPLPMNDASKESLHNRRVALIVHGGAGVIERGRLSSEDERAIHLELDTALEAGHSVLFRGGSALDAVEAAVRVLEDTPRFNAGHGAVYAADGRHELDASLMDGHDGRAGAVAGVTTVRNPVSLARAVMEHSPHVLLMGPGAEAFADTRDAIERVSNDYFDTDHRRGELETAQAAERGDAEDAQDRKGKYLGTVGAVALDAHGHLAAATSTGGMTNKRWGRVGDSPLIGAGTWADAHVAVSGTGWGEYFIRCAVAHDIAARMAYGGDALHDAADAVIMQSVPALGGDGGAIAIDAMGNLAMPFSTEGMYRGWIAVDGTRGTAIFRA